MTPALAFLRGRGASYMIISNLNAPTHACEGGACGCIGCQVLVVAISYLPLPCPPLSSCHCCPIVVLIPLVILVVVPSSSLLSPCCCPLLIFIWPSQSSCPPPIAKA